MPPCIRTPKTDQFRQATLLRQSGQKEKKVILKENWKSWLEQLLKNELLLFCPLSSQMKCLLEAGCIETNHMYTVHVKL